VAFAIGAAVGALYALVQFRSGTFVVSEGYARLSGVEVGVNSFAAILLCAIAVCVGFAVDKPRSLRGVLLLGVSIVSGSALLLTLSRGAAIGILATVCLACGILALRRPWLGIMAIGVVLGVGVLFLAWPGLDGTTF